MYVQLSIHKAMKIFVLQKDIFSYFICKEILIFIKPLKTKW